MKKNVVLEKALGETPLQTLERFRASDTSLLNVSLTYAGRLDPMATGKLLILIGEECKRKDSYTKLDKEYEFEVLLGIESDTGDVLGMPKLFSSQNMPAKFDMKKISASFVGDATFPYPKYSSKTVEGKALFQHVHDGTLEDIEVPTTTTTIYGLQYLGQRVVTGDEVLTEVLQKIKTLKVNSDPARLGSDFRKDEIALKWQALQGLNEAKFIIARFSTIVSSGTYIRSLAPAIAKKCGTRGLAFSIHRSVIGRYVPLLASLGFWIKKY
jgi:tRNA pseudouridine55 synthase